jgi:hypothetical protein
VLLQGHGKADGFRALRDRGRADITSGGPDAESSEVENVPPAVGLLVSGQIGKDDPVNKRFTLAFGVR